MTTCALAGQWIARIGGALLTLLFLAFLFGEGPPNLAAMTVRERLFSVGIAGVVVGLSLAWKWEGLGGLVTVAGYSLMLVIDPGTISAKLFLMGGALGLLHLACWWGLRSTGSTMRLPAALWAALGLFVLLCGNEAFGNPPLMTPEWRPAANLVGSWHAEPADAAVVFLIRPDAAVTGKLGADLFADAHITRNRTWFGRLMHWRTDYLIQGSVSGQRFSVPLDLTGDSIKGAFFLSGKPVVYSLRMKKDSVTVLP